MEAFDVRLFCPRCRRVEEDGTFVQAPLVLVGGEGPATVSDLPDGDGVLRCTDAGCRAEYPVLDGVGILFRDPGAVDLAANPPFDPLALSLEVLQGLVAGQPFDRGLAALVGRLGRLAWAAFQDWFPASLRTMASERPVHGVEVMEWISSVAPPHRGGKGVRAVMGAGFGREAWEAAGPTVLVDAHLPTLLALGRLLRQGYLDLLLPWTAASWKPVRLELPRPPAEPVRLVCCDLVAPPFGADAFQEVVATNLLDSVHDPVNTFAQLHAMTAPGGSLTITTPFAWKSDVTPRAHWIESLVPGAAGNPETAFETLASSLTPPLEIVARRTFRWTAWHTAREITLYGCSGWYLRKQAPAS